MGDADLAEGTSRIFLEFLAIHKEAEEDIQEAFAHFLKEGKGNGVFEGISRIEIVVLQIRRIRFDPLTVHVGFIVIAFALLLIGFGSLGEFVIPAAFHQIGIEAFFIFLVLFADIFAGRSIGIERGLGDFGKARILFFRFGLDFFFVGVR